MAALQFRAVIPGTRAGRDNACMTPTAQGREPAEPVWTVAAVARRVGVAPATLRSWSVRYGIGPAGHHPGRHRRYTDADVAELDRMRALVDRGMPLHAAAALAREQRHGHSGGGDPGTATTEAAPEVVRHLVRSARRLDTTAATGLIGASLTARGVPDTWDLVCRPALAQLDTATAGDGSCLGATLLLSWAVGAALRRTPAVPDASTGPATLLACAEGEQHSLALDALGAALVERGLPVRMLGASVPGVALLHAAAQLRPAVVVVWSQRSVTAEAGVLDELTGRTELVLAAGPGWDRAALPSPARHADRLVTTLELITTTTRVAGRARD